MLDNGTSGAGVRPDRARIEGTAAAARERSRELREHLAASRSRLSQLWCLVPVEPGHPSRRLEVVGQVQEQLSDARERIEHLETALATNRRIGIAIGVVMARHGLTDEQAFELLRAQSQARNTKLRDLAEEVIYTGTL